LSLVLFLLLTQNAIAEEILLDKGNKFLDAGKYKEAINVYDKVLEQEPNDTAALYNKALALSSLGNFTDAIEYYDKVLVIEPNATDALIGKADNLAQLEKYEEAITLYDKVLEISPNDTYASSMKNVTQDAINIERSIN
jgi:tetratricopeptide (TPR) repeat protein